MKLTSLRLLFALALSVGSFCLAGCGEGDIDGTAATGAAGANQGIGDASNVEPLPPPPKLEVPEGEL